jgi:MFS family permease
MTQPKTTETDARAIRNVAVLVTAQALLGSQLSLIFVIAGLAGQSLASNVCYATLPITMIVFGSMTTAPWLSALMQRFGRRAGFILGCAGGAIGAMISAYGLLQASFPLFLIGSFFTGIYMSAQGFFRFAAADTASDTFRSRAISYVMAGGLVGAVLGPGLVKLTSDIMVIPFLGSYLTVVVLNFLGILLFFALDIPVVSQLATVTGKIRSRWQLIKEPRILVAIICAMVSYSLMNLVMTSTPLAIVGCGFSQSNAADVVSSHVLAMFVPSFFTGHLIDRFGAKRIVATGLVCLGCAGLTGLAGVELLNFFAALILLGLGWNFAFIGATTMLAAAHTPAERGRVQGMNDFMVFGLVTVASAASGSLMNCSGGSPVEGWVSVNLAMIPLLALAAGALIWLFFKEKGARYTAIN